MEADLWVIVLEKARAVGLPALKTKAMEKLPGVFCAASEEALEAAIDVSEEEQVEVWRFGSVFLGSGGEGRE